MKHMEYTIKVVTSTPITPAVMESEIKSALLVDAVTVTNYRVLPTKKPAKVVAS